MGFISMSRLSGVWRRAENEPAAACLSVSLISNQLIITKKKKKMHRVCILLLVFIIAAVRSVEP